MEIKLSGGFRLFPRKDFHGSYKVHQLWFLFWYISWKPINWI